MNSNEAGITALRVSGADAREFLQGQLTQDMNRVEPARPQLAGWTSAKGRLLWAGPLLDHDGAFWLITPAALAAGIRQRLSMFVLRAAVELELPEAHVLPDSNPPDKESINYCIVKDNYIAFRIGGGPALRLWPGLPGDPVADEAEWRRAHVLSGTPTIWAETQEAFVPQMLNLDLLGAISFSKGCYIGQEIVARTQNLGRIKRRMYGFTSTSGTQVAAGDKLFLDGREAGQVVDAIAHEGQTQLLAVVAIEQCNAVFSLDADGTQPLMRVGLPYAVPESLDED
jgi:folate-binding protein YgfZ